MNKQLILIAEDEPGYAKILKSKLEKDGYTVLVAVNGEIAMQMIHKEKPLLIVLDLLMPVKDGFAVLTEIKQDPLLQDIPVIALSNLSQAEEVARAKRLGAELFIIKTDETFQAVINKIKAQIS